MTSHKDAIEAILTAKFPTGIAIGYRDGNNPSVVIQRIRKPAPPSNSLVEFWLFDITAPTETLLEIGMGVFLKYFNSNHKDGYVYAGGADDPAWFSSNVVFYGRLRVKLEVEARWAL